VRHATTWALALAAALAGVPGCGGQVGFGAGVGGGGVGVGASKDSHRRDVEEWYEGRVKRLTAEDGWLSLVGLFPLPPGSYTFGSADDNDLVFPAGAPARAGTVVADSAGAILHAAAGVQMTHAGAPVSTLPLATDRDGGTPTEIQMGSIRFYVIDRPGSLYLRVKDAESEVRKRFKGIERFPVSRSWRVEARLDPYDPPRKITILNTAGFEEVVDCPGALVFSIDGREHRLEPTSESEDEWFIVFGDASSGHDTYGGGRFVYVPAPGPDGRTVIDFNRAYNPPCVFTPYATCPLPRPENVLPVRVEAGEKTWEDAGH
jgi:uncharacterized protein (DUF1684 family)